MAERRSEAPPSPQHDEAAVFQDFDPGTNYDRELFIVNPFKAVREEDDFKDSIAFVYPQVELEDNQVNLCGQISGLYKMLLAFPGTPPDFISTRFRGYALKPLGKEFIIAMHSRTMELPAYTAHFLKQLHNIICFYHHSPEKILERAKGRWSHLTRRLRRVMPLYMHYVLLRCQSQMTSVFHCIPYLLSSPGKTESQLMLQANQVLHWCRGSPCVISGCVTHHDKVICSHLPPNLCHYLLILVQDESELLNMLTTAGPTEIDGLPVHLITVYLTQEELAGATPSTRPDLSQTYRRLRRASTHTATHSTRQSRRGRQHPSHTDSGGRSQQGGALKNNLSEGAMGSFLASPHPRYEVVHTTPGRGSSHVMGAQQGDTPYLTGDDSRSDHHVNTAEELERVVGGLEGDLPKLVTISPSTSPSSPTVGHSHPIAINQTANSTSPSHLAVSVSPVTKSSPHSGSDAEIYVTPGHSTPEDLDHQDVSPCTGSSPSGYVFKTPQSSVIESKVLFPQQDSRPVPEQAAEEREGELNEAPQQASEHSDQLKAEDREGPQEAHLKQCCVLILRCFDTAVILLSSDKITERRDEVVRIWENVYHHLNAINAAVKLFQVGDTLPDKSKRTDGTVVSASYSGLDARLKATPLNTSYYHRQCIKLMHTEFVSDPSLIQGTLHEGKHCRMFGQRLGCHESYLQPSEKSASRRATINKHNLSWQQHDSPEASAHQLRKGDSREQHPPFL